MTRQSATQHLAVLEAANLISSVRRGREKLHYSNPVPLQEIQERWIDKFERPRLRVLSALKRQAEEAQMADKPTYVYVTSIQSTAEQVWHALTDAELSAPPLTVTHENLADHAEYDAACAGWPAVFANLKSLIETGHVLPQAPWEMHAELRAAQMAQNDPR